MKYSKYLMEEKIFNTSGMPGLLKVIVAICGVGLIAGLMPVAYTIDKTNDVWKKLNL